MRMRDENAKKNPYCLANTKGYSTHIGMSTGCYGYGYR